MQHYTLKTDEEAEYALVYFIEVKPMCVCVCVCVCVCDRGRLYSDSLSGREETLIFVK